MSPHCPVGRAHTRVHTFLHICVCKTFDITTTTRGKTAKNKRINEIPKIAQRNPNNHAKWTGGMGGVWEREREKSKILLGPLPLHSRTIFISGNAYNREKKSGIRTHQTKSTLKICSYSSAVEWNECLNATDNCNFAFVSTFQKKRREENTPLVRWYGNGTQPPKTVTYNIFWHFLSSRNDCKTSDADEWHCSTHVIHPFQFPITTNSVIWIYRNSSKHC